MIIHTHIDVGLIGQRSHTCKVSIWNSTAIHIWTARATMNKQLQQSVLSTHGRLELQGTSNISHCIYSIRDHSSQQGHRSIEHHVDGKGVNRYGTETHIKSMAGRTLS